jgi:deoxyribonuclease-4
MGAKGVVVHVGKSVGMPIMVALENMRGNLRQAMSYATEECPILLETPAGQGTETLTAPTDFIEFVESFADVRLRACVDTCHIFVCGYDPVEYIEMFVGPDATPERQALLKLIHYNDAAVAKGSRKDRHAFMGTGKIGMEMMEDIAGCCYSYGLPMVIE